MEMRLQIVSCQCDLSLFMLSILIICHDSSSKYLTSNHNQSHFHILYKQKSSGSRKMSLSDAYLDQVSFVPQTIGKCDWQFYNDSKHAYEEGLVSRFCLYIVIYYVKDLRCIQSVFSFVMQYFEFRFFNFKQKRPQHPPHEKDVISIPFQLCLTRPSTITASITIRFLSFDFS